MVKLCVSSPGEAHFAEEAEMQFSVGDSGGGSFGLVRKQLGTIEQ